MFRTYVFFFTLLPAFALAEPTALPVELDGGTKGVQFDMDISKEGLDYLNYKDSDMATRGANGMLLDGVGTGARSGAGQGRDEATHPKFLLPAIMTFHALDIGASHIVAGSLSPFFAAGSADHFETPEKFMSNRPVGKRDGSGGHNLNRNLGTTTIENFIPSGTNEQETTERAPRRHSAGTTPMRSEELTVFQLPKAGLEVTGYTADLPEKQNANRPVGRTSGGRGNSRELYPAHPDSP